MPEPATTAAPSTGLWRIGRWPDPFSFPTPQSPLPMLANEVVLGGGRFDDPRGTYSTLYCATSAACAYGETISVFRTQRGVLARMEAFLEGSPDPEYDPDLEPGVIPANFLSGRAIGWVPIDATARFVDMADHVTHRDGTMRAAQLLNRYGLRELDRGVVMSQDRRLTRPLGRLYYDLRARQGVAWAGLCYESRHRGGWQCWAIWDSDALLGLEARIYPIDPASPALAEAAQIVGVAISTPALRDFE
jgi:hypothetical protein